MHSAIALGEALEAYALAAFDMIGTDSDIEAAQEEFCGYCGFCIGGGGGIHLPSGRKNL